MLSTPLNLDFKSVQSPFEITFSAVAIDAVETRGL